MVSEIKKLKMKSDPELIQNLKVNIKICVIFLNRKYIDIIDDPKLVQKYCNCLFLGLMIKMISSEYCIQIFELCELSQQNAEQFVTTNRKQYTRRLSIVAKVKMDSISNSIENNKINKVLMFHVNCIKFRKKHLSILVNAITGSKGDKLIFLEHHRNCL